MRKKTSLSAMLVVMLVVCVVIGTSNWSKKPFEDLAREDIRSVSVLLSPSGAQIVLDEGQIDDLVDLLREVVIYQRDASAYVGQSVSFSITRTDGTQLSITQCSPVLGIDGVFYRAEYAPCEALNWFANHLEA